MTPRERELIRKLLRNPGLRFETEPPELLDLAQRRLAVAYRSGTTSTGAAERSWYATEAGKETFYGEAAESELHFGTPVSEQRFLDQQRKEHARGHPNSDTQGCPECP